jgi:DNA-binding winged helix-turn-helix (wHTH) protein
MTRGTIQIGGWRFDPAGGELARGGERRRLEDRAARTLDLLCRRRGEVVTQAEIVAEVWAGRQQSPNSVAVVISDIRRALEDDAREPAHIETVTKRGYRLRPERPDMAAARPPRTLSPGALSPVWAFALTGAAITALALTLLWRNAHPARPVARIEAVVNQTGDRRYDPLARAVEGLVTTDLLAQGRLTLLAPDAKRRPDLVVKSQLILWTGYPAVALSAVDPATGVTLWSGMAPGPEAALPRQVAHELAAFGAGLPKPKP